MTVLEWRRKHKKCRFCRYCKLVIDSYTDITIAHCEAKDKFYNWNASKPFCKLYEPNRKVELEENG